MGVIPLKWEEVEYLPTRVYFKDAWVCPECGLKFPEHAQLYVSAQTGVPLHPQMSNGPCKSLFEMPDPRIDGWWNA